MAQTRLVERLVGIGHVHAAIDHAGHQGARAVLVSPVLEGCSRRFVPDVAPGGVALLAEGLALELIISQHAEGRDDVLAEVLILVVAPDDHEVGVEGVKFLPQFAEAGDHSLAQAHRRCVALVLAVLDAHGFRPVGWVLHLGRHAVVGPEGALEG